jgi:hypothetical protein
MQISLQQLPKDTLTLIALELDLPSLLNFCQSDIEINKKVCSDNNFWRNKLFRDYPNIAVNNLKELYETEYEKDTKIRHLDTLMLDFIKNSDFGAFSVGTFTKDNAESNNIHILITQNLAPATIAIINRNILTSLLYIYLSRNNLKFKVRNEIRFKLDNNLRTATYLIRDNDFDVNSFSYADLIKLAESSLKEEIPGLNNIPDIKNKLYKLQNMFTKTKETYG